MAGVVKGLTGSGQAFSFADLEAQAEQIRRQAAARAAQIITDARQNAEVAARIVRDEARRDGFEAGRKSATEQVLKESRSTALAEAREHVQQLCAALRRALDDFEAARHGLLAQAETGLIELALAIARRVCKNRAQQAAHAADSVAAANARALLEMVRHDGVVELFFHPRDAELLRTLDPAALAGKPRDGVVIRDDPGLCPGDCRLSTRQGTIDATLDTQLARIAEALGADCRKTSGECAADGIANADTAAGGPAPDEPRNSAESAISIGRNGELEGAS